MKSRAEQLSERVRAQGYRLTRQRQVVLEELAKVDSHPRADQIYQLVRKRIPNISFGTIYRNLRTLHELGLLALVQYGGKSVRFDANIGDHQHFVCRRCEQILDIDADSGLDFKVPGLTRRGFSVDTCDVQLIGLCPSCLKKERSQ